MLAALQLDLLVARLKELSAKDLADFYKNTYKEAYKEGQKDAKETCGCKTED